jgi:hypothetical protein
MLMTMSLKVSLCLWEEDMPDVMQTTYSLVLSVAVVSMKMFLVFPGTILESA